MKTLTFLFLIVIELISLDIKSTKTTQWGTSGQDEVKAIVNYQNYTYILENTSKTKWGDSDVILHKISKDGSIIWKIVLESNADDIGKDLAVDSEGNIYIVGYTNGSLGENNFGDYDLFVAKYNANGKKLWIFQYGSESYDEATSIAINPIFNGVLIAGNTKGDIGNHINQGRTDVFMSEINGNGRLIGSLYLASSSDENANDIKCKSEFCYIVGYTEGALEGSKIGSWDAFIWKINHFYGNKVWINQFGTSVADEANVIAIDSDNYLYVSGWTSGDMSNANKGIQDIFLKKFTSEGVESWTRQVGTSENDDIYDILIDKYHNIYLAGYASGDLFLIQYQQNGLQNWIRRQGENEFEILSSISINYKGDIFLGGYTYGSVRQDKINQGYRDAIFFQYNFETEWTSGQYENNTLLEKELVIYDAQSLLVSINGEVENIYDRVKIFDEKDMFVKILTGKINEKFIIKGSKLKIVLEADDSIRKDGINVEIKKYIPISPILYLLN